MSAPEPTPAPRRTRQRDAVAAALAAHDGFVSAQSLHAALRADGASVGLTTVYRTLAGLAAAGVADALTGEDGETLYRRCSSSGHHHHLVCRRCGRTAEVAGPAVESWAARVAEAEGYTEVRHTLEIFGRCPACSQG